MSTSTTFAMFDVAAADAGQRRRDREVAERFAQERAAQKLRQQLAAKKAEQKQAEQARIAKLKAEEAAEQLARTVEKFQQDFGLAVVAHARRVDWSETAIMQAKAYCAALVSTSDTLPTIDPTMGAVIHDKFAATMLEVGGQIPVHYFVGQCQDWFTVLYADKQGLSKPPRLVITPGSKPRSISPSVVVYTTSTIADTLPPATTLPSRKNRRRGKQRA